MKKNKTHHKNHCFPPFGPVQGNLVNACLRLVIVLNLVLAAAPFTHAQTPFVTGTRLGPVQSNLPSDRWQELILNDDGSINWGQYSFVANNYNRPDIQDYRLGPRYNYYHSTTASFPTVSQIGSNGWDPYPYDYYANTPKRIDWHQKSGQLLYQPEASNDPGMARARIGTVSCLASAPTVISDMRISWTPDKANYWNENPDMATRHASWLSASGGKLPNPPIAIARAKYMTSLTGAVIYPNGLVGFTGNGNDPNTWTVTNNDYSTWRIEPYYPFVKLPSGKIPTAVAMTLNHEFILVTVWDVVNRKGQLGVIAVQAHLTSSDHFSTFSASNMPFFWSMPNFGRVNRLKLLGFIDLPFAAPTSIEATADIGMTQGRVDPSATMSPDFGSQSERDKWRNWTGGYYRRTARAGYAIVASRSENKVAFVDLQPLYQYVRDMMFTTSSNHYATRNQGLLDSQWPYTFNHAPQQRPVVRTVYSVPTPTAVACGFGRDGAFFFDRPSDFDGELFRVSAYVTSMDGTLRIYNAASLNKVGSKSAPSLVKTVNVGKNPSHIAYGLQGGREANRLTITCRGDRAVYSVTTGGSIAKVLRDSRLVDPVSAEVGHQWRGCGGMATVSVMDYNGKQAVNYVTQKFTGYTPQDIGFRFGAATPVPGKPFLISIAEVL
jgi:hypothetical protein